MSKKRSKKRPQLAVAPKQDDKLKIFIKEKDPTKVARGHQPRLSGAGTHDDRRTKRQRTRSSQKRRALGEWQ